MLKKRRSKCYAAYRQKSHSACSQLCSKSGLPIDDVEIGPDLRIHAKLTRRKQHMTCRTNMFTTTLTRRKKYMTLLHCGPSSYQRQCLSCRRKGTPCLLISVLTQPSRLSPVAHLRLGLTRQTFRAQMLSAWRLFDAFAGRDTFAVLVTELVSFSAAYAL